MPDRKVQIEDREEAIRFYSGEIERLEEFIKLFDEVSNDHIHPEADVMSSKDVVIAEECANYLKEFFDSRIKAYRESLKTERMELDKLK